MSDPWLLGVRDDVVQYLQSLLVGRGRGQFIRDDYREVAELTLKVLGVEPARSGFLRPGACHHARWMARVSEIYLPVNCLVMCSETNLSFRTNA